MMSLQAQWAMRTNREKIMLAGLAVLLLGIAEWYGVLKPVQSWRDSAAFDRQSAEMRLARINRQIEEAKAYKKGGSNARQALEQAARQAGVQIQISTQGNGLKFELDRIPSASGRAFLVHMEQQKLSPSSLRIDAYEDGTLRISGQTG